METDYDVLIVGAGISGIGAACHLKTRLPGKTFAVLEAREALGGTWDLFRFPGIRSDSDLHTFGYEFKPWTSDHMIADAHEIVDYLREAAAEHDVLSHIRTGHRVLDASWSSEDVCWTVRVRVGGEERTLTSKVLFGATGYYDHDRGFRPEFAGEADFAGRIVHPQDWPEDLDHAGKRVVVIGSGATAVTLIPAMADTTEHITMLQRSPGYIMSVPRRNPIANGLRRVLPEKTAYRVTRKLHIGFWRGMWTVSRRYPGAVKRVIRTATKAQLPRGHRFDEPSYNPWDERLCAVPDGDLFKAISAGRASVVTDHIERFTPGGVLLTSGRELEADIIVVSTGLNMLPLGGLQLVVDGEPVDYSQKVVFKSMMLDGVPNFAYAMGYTNISWTLKVDLVCEHFCRLLAHMDALGHDTFVPELDDPTLERLPLFDGFDAGYVKRSLELWPKQGSREPWRLSMSYIIDVAKIRHGRVDDGVLRFA